MEQNQKKSSAAAQRAKAGAKIVHILPLEPNGSHPTLTWGMIEDGVLAKNSKKAIDQDSFDEYKKKTKGVKRKNKSVAATADEDEDDAQASSTPAAKRTKG